MIDNTVFEEGYKEQSFAEQGWYIRNMLNYISDTGLVYELFLIIRVAEGQ